MNDNGKDFCKTMPLIRHLPPLRPRLKMPLAFSISESNLDHLVDIWSRKTPEPAFATIRARLFLQHVTVTLETHPLYEQVLVQARTGGIVPLSALSTLIETIVDRVTRALYAARLPHKTDESGNDRFPISVPDFLDNVHALLSRLDNPHHRDLIDYMDTKRVTGIIRDALMTIAQEYALIRQISETAKLIRRMNEKLASGTLPDEDLYELKLRRDLFLTDLRLYNRFIRIATTNTKKGSLSTTEDKTLSKTPLLRAPFSEGPDARPAPSLFSRLFRG